MLEILYALLLARLQEHQFCLLVLFVVALVDHIRDAVDVSVFLSLLEDILVPLHPGYFPPGVLAEGGVDEVQELVPMRL